MLTRRIGKILRGKATPLQIMMAAILGAMLGFVPGFWQAPGLVVALALLLIILNANLAVAAIVALIAKLVSWPLLPLSFGAGRLLLDGPAQGLFKWIINAPVLALFGFEHYVTTGGTLIGLAFGVLCGSVLVRLVHRFRSRMSALEEGSERFRQFAGQRWVKITTWIFIGGGHGKKTYAQLMQTRVGNPVRILGVMFAALLIALLFIAQAYLSGPILTMAMRDALERANGATVDLEHADVDLKAGRFTVNRLAMADPNALQTDVFRALKLEGDVNAADLLRKRVRFDRIVVSEATSGATRTTPGRLVGPPPTPPPPPAPEGDEKTIDDYIADARQWKQRLAQAREWLEKLSPPQDDPDRRETIEERVKRQILESGYARAKASHLIDQSPSLVISELIAEGVTAVKLEGEVLDIKAHNLSTHPWLIEQSPRIDVRSRSGRIIVAANLKEAAAPATGQPAGDDHPTGPRNQLRFTCLGMSADSIAKAMKVAGQPPFSGGTMDVDLRGKWSGAGVGDLNLPLRVTLRDTTLTIPRAGSQPVKEFKLALGLRGPMDNPRIHIDQKQLADALAAAGADRLASHVRGEADRAVAEAKDKASKKVEEKLGGKLGDAIGDKAKGALDGLMPKQN